jgi:hypothetical protein
MADSKEPVKMRALGGGGGVLVLVSEVSCEERVVQLP